MKLNAVELIFRTLSCHFYMIGMKKNLNTFYLILFVIVSVYHVRFVFNLALQYNQ